MGPVAMHSADAPLLAAALLHAPTLNPLLQCLSAWAPPTHHCPMGCDSYLCGLDLPSAACALPHCPVPWGRGRKQQPEGVLYLGQCGEQWVRARRPQFNPLWIAYNPWAVSWAALK